MVVNPEIDDFIGVDEACQILNIKRGTLYNKVSRKEIPFYKPAGKLLFSRTELTNLIQGSGKGQEYEDQVVGYVKLYETPVRGRVSADGKSFIPDPDQKLPEEYVDEQSNQSDSTIQSIKGGYCLHTPP